MRKKSIAERQAFGEIKKMPPKKHSEDGREFDITASEVCEWLVSLPDVRQFVFDRFRYSGVIVFDTETKTWKGADYGKD